MQGTTFAPSTHGGGDDLYDDNAGTTLSIVGDDFCVLAGDTRHSAAYSINTRQATKLFVIDGRLVLSTAGFYADSRSVLAHLTYAVEDYQFRFGKQMDVVQAAAILHTILYRYRFFPKYTYCCLAGFTQAGEPKLFSYDPVGSYQETKGRCNGSGTKLLQPFIDSWISRHNWGCEEGRNQECSQGEMVQLVKDVFNSAAETDVKTGDGLEIYVLRKEGITREEHHLRSD
ncbi:2S proteasome subunit beta 6 [Nematocida displodere]|uniref:Proteasome subunit beta n=1 Tax=Nematocida displodere TaxID=1805483 RepID=A0A177EIV1_9MICR|nr:2S proteasome subunit beta 6 [Nematocida displodere]